MSGDHQGVNDDHQGVMWLLWCWMYGLTRKNEHTSFRCHLCSIPLCAKHLMNSISIFKAITLGGWVGALGRWGWGGHWEGWGYWEAGWALGGVGQREWHGGHCVTMGACVCGMCMLCVV